MTEYARRATLALIVGSMAMAGLTACGGSDETGTTAAAQPAPDGGGAPGQVEMGEFEYLPGDVTATAGSTLTVKNTGAVEHDLRLRRDGENAGGTKSVAPGESVDFKVGAKAGAYEMFCSLPGHEAAGMKGTFDVE